MLLKAGIVGAGLAGRWHAQAAQKSGANVIAVADPDPVKAIALAKRFPDASVHKGLTEMLVQQKPDVLHICAPTSTHAELSTQALSSGIHVMLEKPMARSFEEVQKLYALAEKQNMLLCPAHQFGFQDGVKKILSHLTDAGEIVEVEVVIRSAGGEFSKSENLDEIACDILPHPLSLIQQFISKSLPDSGWAVVRPRFGDFRCSTAADKIGIGLSISMSGRPPVCSLSVVGTQGSFHADLFHGSAYFEPGSVSHFRKISRPFSTSIRSLSSSTRNLTRRIVRWEPAYPGMRQLISEFYDAVTNRTASPISSQDALRVASVRDVLIQQLRV